MVVELILGVATVLGGLAALWYFWDKILEWVRPAPPAREEAGPKTIEEKWVDIGYPASAGLTAQWEAQGYQVRWCFDSNVSRRVDLEGWEEAKIQEGNDREVVLRLRDRPENQTLIRKKTR